MMAFDECGVGDTHELGACAQLFDVVLAAVAHACPKSAHKLEDHVRQTAAEGNPALDAFGDELLCARLEEIGRASCRERV